MTIWNLGSINADHIYRVGHLPMPGETLAAQSHQLMLGGKGANQSIAAAKAGGDVRHIGMIGADGDAQLAGLIGHGVDCTFVRRASVATGHANVYVDVESGENSIVIFSGANVAQDIDLISEALSGAQKGDTLILQNETNLTAETARIGHEQGLFVVYSAAPFDAESVRDVLPFVDLLIVNAVELDQLTTAFGVGSDALGVENIVVTLGGDGAQWRHLPSQGITRVKARPVVPVDTTGAGDCFAGYMIAGLAEGMTREQAMRFAADAAALKVTRTGTGDAIPSRAEVEAFSK